MNPRVPFHVNAQTDVGAVVVEGAELPGGALFGVHTGCQLNCGCLSLVGAQKQSKAGFHGAQGNRLGVFRSRCHLRHRDRRCRCGLFGFVNGLRSNGLPSCPRIRTGRLPRDTNTHRQTENHEQHQGADRTQGDTPKNARDLFTGGSSLIGRPPVSPLGWLTED